MDKKMKLLRRKDPKEYERLMKEKEKKRIEGSSERTYGPLSDEHRKNISDGLKRSKANREARKKAFASKDTIPLARRKYTRRSPIASVQMAGAVHDLETFIGNLSSMSATDYLEAREELIRSIIRRGGANGNSTA